MPRTIHKTSTGLICKKLNDNQNMICERIDNLKSMFPEIRFPEHKYTLKNGKWIILY